MVVSPDEPQRRRLVPPLRAARVAGSAAAAAAVSPIATSAPRRRGPGAPSTEFRVSITTSEESGWDSQPMIPRSSLDRVPSIHNDRRRVRLGSPTNDPQASDSCEPGMNPGSALDPRRVRGFLANVIMHAFFVIVFKYLLGSRRGVLQMQISSATRRQQQLEGGGGRGGEDHLRPLRHPPRPRGPVRGPRPPERGTGGGAAKEGTAAALARSTRTCRHVLTPVHECVGFQKFWLFYLMVHRRSSRRAEP
eukprot:gene13330-biopygen12954